MNPGSAKTTTWDSGWVCHCKPDTSSTPPPKTTNATTHTGTPTRCVLPMLVPVLWHQGRRVNEENVKLPIHEALLPSALLHVPPVVLPERQRREAGARMQGIAALPMKLHLPIRTQSCVSYSINDQTYGSVRCWLKDTAKNNKHGKQGRWT
jgi:hypothetical protein